ncbi:ribosylnicotinamide kinase [Ptychographa xylographoides]|nr:ribosylnicotinamide kinase [Ptychographa xylographoides]
MPKATILGLSGASSSGKTTLARLLRSIFPHTLILHEDDFYRPEEQLPFRAGLKDWDCAAALDIPALVKALGFIRENGKLPDWLVSKEDQNSIGKHGVSEKTIERFKEIVHKWNEAEGKEQVSVHRKLVILDGFLLFGESVKDVRDGIDIKLMLRAKFMKAKERRENRSGYVTLEGFWEDPPGYVEKVVWPGYVEEHAFMFEDGNVDGVVNSKVVEQLGIHICPGHGEWTIERVLEWAIENIMKALEQRDVREGLRSADRH